ncbi:hypothetical protein IM816_08275 [Luteibacter flocculans]|uniref:Uncharacterized protein n=1 Tax=Luteibacter flocculans TaxID=2780091 RepID=A0ABY4T771_9GAMM|nr:hypothetical protein [Luteibacter flocculans]URL60064.1 hypothetical protein IM816_08275 [Luteibacter flocculans]
MDGSKTYKAMRKASTAPAPGALADDPLPEVLAFPSDALAPLPPNGFADNLLLASTRGTSLDLTLPLNEQIYPGDTLQLELNGTRVGSPHEVTDEEYSAGQVTLTLTGEDRDSVPEGTVEINYDVDFLSGGGLPNTGPLGQRYITDYTAEGAPFLGEPRFEASVIANGIIPDSLETDASDREYLPAQVPSYFQKAPGDKITPKIDGISDDSAAVIVQTVSMTTEIPYFRTFIEDQGDGPHDFGYIVTDRAGNVSDESRVVTLTALLKDYLTDLIKPGVPAFDDDADVPLIDEADARKPGGLEVIIPGNPSLSSTDQIEVQWGSRIATRVPAQTGTEITVLLPYAIVSDEWHSGGAPADEARAVDVSYTVYRNTISRGRSPAHTVEVNLFVAGGKDPDPETPENENLTRPTLAASSGAENEISGPDFEEDATVTVPWLLEGSLTATPFVEGDILTVRYGSVDLTPRPITDADVTAAVDINDIVLNNAAIKTVGSGTVPLSYRIARSLTSGGSNEDYSPPQDVLVKGSDELPGGGNPLPVGSIPEADGTYPDDPTRQLISRKEAVDGTEFIIPAYVNQKPGDAITVTAKAFRPFYRSEATQTPVSERDFEIPDLHPTDETSPTRVHIEESTLMRYDLLGIGFHFHISYTVFGVADPTIPVASAEYLVDMDSRGTLP